MKLIMMVMIMIISVIKIMLIIISIMIVIIIPIKMMMITKANWNCGAPNAPVLHSEPVKPPQISFNEVYSASQFSRMSAFHDLSLTFLLI